MGPSGSPAGLTNATGAKAGVRASIRDGDGDGDGDGAKAGVRASIRDGLRGSYASCGYVPAMCVGSVLGL